MQEKIMALALIGILAIIIISVLTAGLDSASSFLESKTTQGTQSITGFQSYIR